MAGTYLLFYFKLDTIYPSFVFKMFFLPSELIHPVENHFVNALSWKNDSLCQIDVLAIFKRAWSKRCFYKSSLLFTFVKWYKGIIAKYVEIQFDPDSL